ALDPVDPPPVLRERLIARIAAGRDPVERAPTHAPEATLAGAPALLPRPGASPAWPGWLAAASLAAAAMVLLVVRTEVARDRGAAERARAALERRLERAETALDALERDAARTH